jgi:hypothetical protein
MRVNWSGILGERLGRRLGHLGPDFVSGTPAPGPITTECRTRAPRSSSPSTGCTRCCPATTRSTGWTATSPRVTATAPSWRRCRRATSSRRQGCDHGDDPSCFEKQLSTGHESQRGPARNPSWSTVRAESHDGLRGAETCTAYGAAWRTAEFVEIQDRRVSPGFVERSTQIRSSQVGRSAVPRWLAGSGAHDAERLPRIGHAGVGTGHAEA